MSENRKVSISAIVVMVFVLGLFSPMSQHARAAIPVPHNLYGHAWDVNGVNYTPGFYISAWIDGVEYGWNLTFDDLLDPGWPNFNYSSKIDIDTAGNQVTIPSDPDTPWVKEGGDQGVDDIMYVEGDMTELVTGGMGSNIFENTTVWQTFVSEYIDLTMATIQPPALPKINNVVTQPGDMGTQYIYIYGPEGTPMDEFYLEKNDGVLHNAATQIFLSGTISETKYFYVDLGAVDYLDPNGDELKLLWENPGGPGAPFGGMDVVVDRVEYNATSGGTHFGEPDNTIMPDAIAPGMGLDIHRIPFAGDDTNDCSVDFLSGTEPGRPPTAPYPLKVEVLGVANGPGETIDHVVNRVNPLLEWTHNDPDVPPLPPFGYKVEIANDSAFSDIRWASYQTSSGAESENYGGPYLTEGACFYYRARTKDAYDYGPWANTTVCMNTPPPVPMTIYPHNETVDPINLSMNWSLVSDAEGDTVTYHVQADEDSAFSLPPFFTDESVPVNESTGKNYNAQTTYYWRVRAYDGYEYSAWSNDPWYWWFNTTNPPLEPWVEFMAVEGWYAPSMEADHITNRVNPTFNWTFMDGNLGDNQQAFNAELRDQPSGGGNLIWFTTGGAAEQVTYDGAPLSECTNYYFRVEVQDDSPSQLWSLTWEEIAFHTNCVPTVPVLNLPANQSALNENMNEQVFWIASSDDDPFDFISYEWVVDTECPAVAPYFASGSTTNTFSDPFDTTGMGPTTFYWTVRANDTWEYSAWAGCYEFDVLQPNERPLAATNLAVDGFTAAPEITHLLNLLPTFTWTFNDPDPGDTQGGRHVEVNLGPGGANNIWWSNTTDPAESVDYPPTAQPLVMCQDYYFRVLTRDAGGLWAADTDWAEILFHTNCEPDVPVLADPQDGNVTTPDAAQTLTWQPSSDGDSDTVTYNLEVSTDSSMTPIVHQDTTTTTSSSFTTTSGECYWWRVNGTDGYVYTAWSTVWSFCVNNPPDAPTDLAVDGFSLPPNVTHIRVSEPALSWNYSDPDGDAQTEFEVEVQNDTGVPIWTYSELSASETVDYNADGTAPAFVPGDSYSFRVRTKDASMWSAWSALLQFELSAPPPAPILTDPADAATGVSFTPTLNWTSGGDDPNGDSVTYHWYLDNETSVTYPWIENDTTALLTATVSTQLDGSTTYYWRVCAEDGWEQPQCSAIRSFTTQVPANIAPTANAGGPYEVTEDTQLTLSGSGTDTDGTIVLYEWDFEDDGTWDSSSSTSGTATHTYTEPGTYTARLRVTDDDGATGEATATVTVKEKAPAPDFLGEYWWILLIIIIIVILLLILLAKRKKPEEEGIEEEEMEVPAVEEEVPPEEEEAAEEKAEMKECPNCGTVLAADDTECFMCGAKV
ncbi:MAG: PKD domain-containing protein [Thermoplasmata archaeon]